MVSIAAIRYSFLYGVQMARSRKTPDAVPGPLESVRVDKWLWSARMYKTRTMATEACSSGNVKVNNGTAKASQKVKVGDEISALTPGGKRILQVAVLAERRGSASIAASLYEDLTPPEPKEIAPPRFERGQGRPSKRDRRRLDRLHGRR
jgi:ribosome-associated heat shock protein Hsp15